VCGLIAMDNEPGLPPGPDRTPAILAAILVKSLTIRGLIQTEEDIVDGLENAPEAFLGMLDGKNFGKLLVPVS
jgi:NADPH-dependent curcumin reductase